MASMTQILRGEKAMNQNAWQAPSPTKTQAKPQTQAQPQAKTQPAASQVTPVKPYTGNLWITTPFETGHQAIDFAGPSVGTPVLAPDQITILSAGWDTSGYGNLVVGQDSAGNRLLFAHLSKITVQPGQVLNPGQSVGLLGTTGHSTGPHLHFEIRSGTGPYYPGRINPLNYLSALGETGANLFGYPQSNGITQTQPAQQASLSALSALSVVTLDRVTQTNPVTMASSTPVITPKASTTPAKATLARVTQTPALTGPLASSTPGTASGSTPTAQPVPLPGTAGMYYWPGQGVNTSPTTAPADQSNPLGIPTTSQITSFSKNAGVAILGAVLIALGLLTIILSFRGEVASTAGKVVKEAIA